MTYKLIKHERAVPKQTTRIISFRLSNHGHWIRVYGVCVYVYGPHIRARLKNTLGQS